EKPGRRVEERLFQSRIPLTWQGKPADHQTEQDNGGDEHDGLQVKLHGWNPRLRRHTTPSTSAGSRNIMPQRRFGALTQQGRGSMFLRVDKLQVDLPPPARQDPNAAAALQELLGGKYGEMSTLGNYLFQSFNFRSKSKLRPFYSLVAAITAEELGHVELVSNGVAMLNNGPDERSKDEIGPTDVSAAPFAAMKDARLAAGFLSHGGGAVPFDSTGMTWNKDFVTTTGNVIFDLLHNFHLE